MAPSHLVELSSAHSALVLVIDVQGKLFDLMFNTEQVRATAVKVLRLAELFSVPTLLTEQYPKGLGPTDGAVLGAFEALTGPAHRLEKTSFGCCGDLSFSSALEALTDERRRDDGPVDLVVAGIETHVCVHQTVMELLRRGEHRVLVLEDGVGSRVQAYHRQALGRFRDAGAVLTNFETLAFEWTRDKENPRFKTVSGLVKG